ncbi:hydroxyquinol 1,2-dioxygenase [Tistlia consotensis]|uniref:Hydroxyquinol 1,2-dioxygenase n=1 Tax=Tistlia consotensis USBA 355 TaxID=560819 RepID=A0A1Y6B889_9PROT|nr:dioxygenase [Tistlia consotensis]SME98090.1 hydroxyquinol 1,2-dioxygenase [Tistlia consotensis USBA 355]SNR57492.1 hydroxyquinol 1,2-dioxygenase [Tistlia consotensis]
MREIDAESLTEAVIERLAGTPDPRMRQVGEALVRHLHAFVREVAPSQAEWHAAIDFLTRTGQTCDAKRQEFILLSDTLGVSMLVDAINAGRRGEATETTVLGPFYVEGAPGFPLGADISGGVEGRPLLVSGSVSGAGGGPLAGAQLDVWHADPRGFYDVQNLEGYALRGRLSTDADGRFRFWSVKPTFYPVPDDGPVGELLRAQARHPYRPAHVHFMIAAEGYETLVTHVFEAGDPYLDSDAVFGVKEALIRPFVEQQPGRAPDGRILDRPWSSLAYDFVLKPLAPG